ncbi:MAG: efflux RND transporter periplasmic adaptor subunit [Verrucomicrobiota bacterium]
MKRIITWLIGISFLAIALRLGLPYLPGGAARGGTEKIAVAYHQVTRGSFLVSIIEGGNVEAVNEVVVRNELQGNSRIIYIIPEGSVVEEGDLLIELDAAEAENALNQQQIGYESSLAKKITAENSLVIAQSTADSDVTSAELDVKFAEMALEKFESMDRAQQVRNAEIDVITARESLQIASEKLRWTEQLTGKGFETKSNLDRDRLAVTNQELALEKAENALKTLTEFDLKRFHAAYEADLSEAKKKLERVRKQGESKITQAEADLRSATATLKLNEEKLAKSKTQFEATKLYAPQGGLVVYASSRRYSNDAQIDEGATVRQRQEIIKIPDISSMKVNLKVHESHISQVRPGMMAFVTFDSRPDERYRGEVSKIAVLPDKSSNWANPNLKVYPTEILITEDLPDIKPGVSARAEIIITQLQDVLTVPIQSVTTVSGHQVCYVRGISGPRPKKVAVGLFNNRFIEIRSGLEEGQSVLLAPPLDETGDLGIDVIDDSLAEELPEQLPTGERESTSPASNPPASPTSPSGNKGQRPFKGGKGPGSGVKTPRQLPEDT